MVTVLLFAALQQVPPPEPRRSVPDPGVIATAQEVTPAGVQAVFQGRVAGVRFGARASEIWVAVPGGAYHLDWRADRVLSVGRFDGTPGVHGLATDPATGRVFVSSVGRLPDEVATSRTPEVPLPEDARVIAQLNVFDAAAAGENVRPSISSNALGGYMAGGPAVARRTNRGGHRVAIVPLPADDRVAVIDAATGALVHLVDTGVLPVAAVVSADGTEAWVTTFGGAKPTSRDRAAAQCCDPRAEPVRVDERGLAETGTVARIDPVSGRVTASVEVGRHPTGLAWDTARGRLYVADGNSDAVSVVDTRAARRVDTLEIAPFVERGVGLAPTAVALSPDGGTLFVALGGANAVAVYDVSGGAGILKGLIPTGWYPSTLDVSGDGTTLAVGTLLGVGSGEGETSGSPGLTGRYVHAVRGSVNVIPVPTGSELAAYTTSVAKNDRLTLAGSAGAPSLEPRRGVAARAVPERPGEPSLIDHVVFVIRENRTYDQVLGDMGRGAGDSSLVIYGRDVTPNAHALADRYVLLDHFFASGGNSADGHQWLTQANETEYPMWPLYQGRSYPSEGVDPLTYSPGGFLWEAAAGQGQDGVRLRRVRAGAVGRPTRPRASACWPQFRDGGARPRVVPETSWRGCTTPARRSPPSTRVLVRDYPGWTMEHAGRCEGGRGPRRASSAWEAAGSMPNLVMIILPSDHTSGTVARLEHAEGVGGRQRPRARARRGRAHALVVLEVDGRCSWWRTTRRTASTTSTGTARWRSRSRRTRGGTRSTARSTASRAW